MGGDETSASFKAQLYDPASVTLTSTSDMTPGRYEHTATLLPEGTVLMAGGAGWLCFTNGSPRPPGIPAGAVCGFIGILASGDRYDPSTGTFASTGNMVTRRASHRATLLNNGRVLMTGGVETFPLQALSSAELFVPSPLVVPLVVTDLRFDVTTVAAGTSYSVQVSGSNLTEQTFFDVRFSAPGSNAYFVALNWQRGLAASHDVPAGTPLGKWTINGVRAHKDEADHTGNFAPLLAAITVSP